MSFETWPTQSNGIYDISYAAMLQKTFIDGYIDCSGSLYNRLGNVIIGDSANPDFDPSSNGITLNTTRICLGKDSSVTGDNGVAIGNSATTGLQENSISIGYNSIVDASNSVAIGADASANGLNSIALGYNSGTGSYTNSVALGANSTVGANNVISLGDGTQKVGIGTTSPVYTLDISAGTLGSTTDDEIRYARFKSTNPNMSYLDIYERRFNTAGDWQTAATRIQKMIDITKHGYIEFDPPSNGGGLAFGASNGEKMTITSNGNVGIGTTSPSALLSVQPINNTNDQENMLLDFRGDFGVDGKLGIYVTEVHTNGIGPDLRFKGRVYNQPAQVEVMSLKPNGNVGIGTSAPSCPLHINNTIIVKGPWNAFNNNGEDGDYTFPASSVILAHFGFGSGGGDANINESYLITTRNTVGGDANVEKLINATYVKYNVIDGVTVRFWAENLPPEYNSTSYTLRISQIWHN